MKKKLTLFAAVALSLGATAASAGAVDELLQQYQTQGAGEFSAERGKQRWHEDHPDPEQPGKVRNCSSCHTNDFKAIGKHAKTGEEIDPLAPSVNKERLTDKKFIEKWLKRNCKWVINRECTPQEKGDYLVFLRDQ